MPAKTFALLVGINDYPLEVGRLRGCRNDVASFHEYLKDTVAADSLGVEVLEDADATRANIIRLFRDHLGRAQRDDVVVFQFCGHGARWTSAAPFREFYPAGKDEGLVCYDSRSDAAPCPYDLADKELAVLIAEVARNAPHIAVILDCCHSGSGTRGVDDFEHFKARVTHEVFRERPLDTYLDGYYTERRARGEPLSIPTSRHVLLAACRRDQKAWEAHDEQGVFTSTLLEVLAKSGDDLSYADLFTRCRAAILSRADNQTPQVETYGDFDAYAGFLGRAVSRPERMRSSVTFDRGAEAWRIDRGVLHGVPGDPDTPVTVAVYAGEQWVASVRTLHVGLHKSTLDFDGDPDVGYRGEITTLPVAPLPILLRGEPEGVRVAEELIASHPHLAVTPLRESGAARYSLLAEEGELWLTRDDDELRIQGVDIEGVTDPAASAALLLPAVRTVTRWERGLALDNPHTRIDASRVDFSFVEILPDGSEHRHHGSDVTLDVVESADGWQPVYAKLKARNRWTDRLHFTLVYFSRAYGVHVLRNEPLEPGDRYATLWGEGPDDAFYVPEGIDETTDLFMLVVSSERVDDFLLAQRPLQLGAKLATDRQARDIGGLTDEPERRKIDNDWFTTTLSVRTVRRLDRVSERDAALAGGRVTVKGHATVTANLSLAAATVHGRGVAAASGAHTFLERNGLERVNLAPTRGVDESVLEITDMRGAESLAEHPLRIDVDVPLADDEYVLPLVFDGHHFILGGEAHRTDAGATHILVDRIVEVDVPEVADQRRSLGKALKLYFFKACLRRPRINTLRWVDFDVDGAVRRHEEDVAAKVSSARDILLLVHGIIGDTENLAEGVRDAELLERHDLVLAYDYENLNTAISRTAEDLAGQLSAVGLGPDDAKRLTILSHSMGGLVAREFIERHGGGALVDHLVMCGTPNDGSPFGEFGTVRSVMSVLTTVALNAFPAMAPYGGAFLSLLNRSQELTVTLEQMSAESAFLAALNASADPGVRYTIVAGDIRGFTEESDRFFAQLVAKAGKGLAFDLLYGGNAHDIAVSLASVHGIGQDRRPPAAKHEASCHHINYFCSDAGLDALRMIRW